jgi:hypothetical protein
MRIRPASAAALLLALGSAGCGDRGAASDWRVVVDTLPNGAPLVRNLPPEEIQARWVIEPELMVGTLEGEGPEQFGQVKGVAPLPDGGLVVLDAQAQELRIFGSDGGHRRTLGGRGEGPGELFGANGILVGPDGLIRVHDPSNARVSLFHPETGFMGSERIPILGWGFLWDAVIDGDGKVYETAIGGTLQDRSWVVRVYDGAGSPTGEIPFEPLGSPGTQEQPGTWRWDRGVMGVPFWPRGIRILDPSPAMWRKRSHVNEYRLARTGLEGDTLLVIESRRSPEPVTAAERDSVIEGVRATVGDQELDWSRIPREHPVVQGAFVDDASRLWVQVTAPHQGTTWDIFGTHGVYVGTAVTDLNVPSYWTPVVRGDLFFALHLGEFDVPYAVRARMREVEGG